MDFFVINSVNYMVLPIPRTVETLFIYFMGYYHLLLLYNNILYISINYLYQSNKIKG